MVKGNMINLHLHWIALIKTLSYRLLGMIGTMLIVLIVTGNLKISVIVGGIEIVVKCVFYYFHEIIWEKITKRIQEKNNV